MKANETDPTIYITDLPVLTQLREVVHSLKSLPLHQILFLDHRTLRSTLRDIRRAIIENKNSILFRSFEGICK
jgi:hypothetical protein